MPAAEIITIGTEILLGEILDTNTGAIARALRGIGLDLFRTGTVGDNAERIAQAISESLARAEVVITTGGLGPTVDDATREAVALATQTELEFHPELWEQIVERFEQFGVEPPENNKRQAMLPKGAVAIRNPVGTAPAFYFEHAEGVIVSLPGVPAELNHLLEGDVIPYLRRTLKLTGVIRSRLLRTAGVGESWLDQRIDDLERMHNPTVGLAAHPGQVDIRITAKAGSEAQAEEMLWKVEATLRQRLGEHIFGVDGEQLEAVALAQVEGRGGRLCSVEVGTGGLLYTTLSDASTGTYADHRVLPDQVTLEEAQAELRELMQISRVTHGLMLHLRQHGEGSSIVIVLQAPEDTHRIERSYAGALPNAPRFAVSLALDQLRRTQADSA